MCQFKSAIVLRNGDVQWSPFTDSHEDLINIAGLADTELGRRQFVRVEYKSHDVTDIEKYKLVIDQDEVPDWFDEKMRERTSDFLRGIVERMIISTGTHKILIGGQYIVCGDARVKSIKTANVVYICGSATVKYIGGSATVMNICGSATVEYIGGSATVMNICGSATVGYIGGSARILNDDREGE